MRQTMKTSRRSPRAVFLRFLPILGVILIDVFFLALLDNLYYNKKRALILEPSERLNAMLNDIGPIRDGISKIPSSEPVVLKEQILKFIEKKAPPILENDNPWFRIELSDANHNLVYTKENLKKIQEWNNNSNCFISRSFKAVTTTQINQGAFNITFFYTSPKNWPAIEKMTRRYWIYAALFIAASWAVFVWLSRMVLRPLERIGQAIGSMIQSDRVVMISRPKHAIEHRFNRMARNQREVLFGLEIERIVDELHTLADDPEVVERFLQGMKQAIHKIYPFTQTHIYVYSPETNRLGAFAAESPPWPDAEADGAVLANGCTISLNAGDLRVGGALCSIDGRSAAKDELAEMAREIKKQAENGLARAFTRSRALTEERNRFGINLATNMGHDLTNIIASGKWDLDTIQRAQNLGIVTMDSKKGSFFLEAVEGLRNNLHFLQEMVNIYRSFGYTRNPRYEPIRLNELIEQVATLFRLSTSQKLTVEVVAEDNLELTAEPRLLRMALFNLLANAAQAIRRSDPRMQGRIVITARWENDKIAVSISDNGPGIRDKEGNLLKDCEIRRIFQSGYTTKDAASGGGLGLSWVRSIVEDFHNGAIDASNRPEGGAQFAFTIPRISGDDRNNP